LFAARATPRYMRNDNGPRFVADVFRRRLDKARVATLFIVKECFWENGHVESFNDKHRDGF
jgi:hypothetical protein